MMKEFSRQFWTTRNSDAILHNKLRNADAFRHKDASRRLPGIAVRTLSLFNGRGCSVCRVRVVTLVGSFGRTVTVIV